MIWFILFVVLVSNIIMFAKHGVVGPITAHVLAGIIWIFYPGYDSGFVSFLITDVVIVAFAAAGALTGPTSAAKIGAAGVGGYFLGRWLGKL